jgi:beta-phosphoglucomutase-like phosphatase (HAD superfamily)
MTVLIFDCDGTLIDSEFLHAQIETDMPREKFGVDSTPIERNNR